MNEVAKNSSPLRVVIYAPGMEFDAETVKEKSLGGSESAAYYLAREIAARGHPVLVFTTHRQPRSGDGVIYSWLGEASQETPLGAHFEHYACNTPHDLLIAQRVPHVFHRQFASKVCIWQLHDLALHRTAPVILGGTWQMDAITVVSQWHADQVKKVWNINPEVLRVVPNGVDPDLYNQESPALGITVCEDPELFGIEEGPDPDSRRVLNVPAEKFLLLYQSRPERGLSNALDLMEKAKLIGLPIHLLVCAYDNPVPQMEGMYSAMYERARSLGNVTLIGALSKPELAILQKACDLLLYPTEFQEVSCITAMESMHAGLPLLTSAVGALPETCTDAGVELIPLKDGKADLEAFEKQLQHYFGLNLPGSYPFVLNEMRKEQREAAATRTWSAAAKRLLDVYQEALIKRQRSPGAILRHAVEHSDIAFAKWYLKELDEQALQLFEQPESDGTWHTPIQPRFDPIVEMTRAEIDRLYQFAHDPKAYADHYDFHQTQYYDQFEEKVIGEDVTRTTRFRGVATFFAQHLNRVGGRSIRILDYGCAHGHYTIPLAKMFPHCEFVGMDISKRAVAAARKWAARDGLENVKFIQGAQADLKVEEGKISFLGEEPFDLVLAGEVLEHVWNYAHLLHLFREHLAPGGALVITTPLGRWEHSGTVAFRTGREHLHHFERGDIEDICRGHEFEVLHAPAAHDRSGFQMSSYVWAVWPKQGIPLSQVNYERKFSRLAPRQTVSVCMIARNAEATLRRCVESFIDWVDEVVVAVDPSTTDNTKEVVASLGNDYPNRPIRWVNGVEALKEGFAAARNESIKHASGDWILWIDADEELRTPANMHRFLRPSMHNGYGWPQIHYSVEPETVLTKDYPCRLFRNHIGVKFYGFVHEHPELTMGEGVNWSLVRQEMKFLHHGYFDEETRQARFRRNLPLLKRDVEAYPSERPLNWFLHLRDTAQSIQFDSRMLGRFTEEHMAEARKGVKLMEKIAELPQTKMVVDSLQYYSLCVATLNQGFDAEISIKTRHPQAPDLSTPLTFNGRFHSRDFFEKLVAKFTQESIKYYDDPHL